MEVLVIVFLIGIVIYCFDTVVIWLTCSNKDVAGKEKIFREELSKAFDNVRYEPLESLSKDEIRSLDFFDEYDNIKGNDLVIADYKGIRFTQCAFYLSVMAYRPRRIRKRESAVFQGQVKLFEFADKFRGPVKVIRYDFFAAKSHAGWQRSVAAFSGRFTIYTRDPIDAEAVLTPRMIEGILYLDKAINIPMAFYFKGNSVYAFLSFGGQGFYGASIRYTLRKEYEKLQKGIDFTKGFIDTIYSKGQQSEETTATVPSQ